MTRRNWLVFAAVLIAASALVLAGCGGDDNGGLSADDMARISAAEAAAAAAQETADAATMEAAMAHEEAEEAKTDAATAQEEAEEAKMDAAAADTRAMDAETALGEAQEEIDDLQDQLDRQAEEAAEYDPTDPGGTREGAPGRAAAKRIADSANGTIRGGVTISSLTQARLGSAPELTISTTGQGVVSSSDDMASVPESSIGGVWMGVAMEKVGAGGITQRALAYSDAERSVRAFGDVYPYNRDSMGRGVETTATANVVLTHRFIVDPPDMATAGNLNTIAAAPITLEHGLTTTGGHTTVTFGDLPAADLDAMRGTFDGVAGQFSCVVADTANTGSCTVTLDSLGVAWLSSTVNNAVVIFKADDPDRLLPDSDYLAFGVWELTPDSPTHANPGQVRPFVKASAPAFNAANIAALAGSAGYNGPAVGHWAVRAAGQHTVQSGRFAAKAKITASFDTAAGAVQAVQNRDEDGNLITGSWSVQYGTAAGVVFSESTIHDFEDLAEMDKMDMSGWLVNLVGPHMINNRVTTPDAVYSTETDAQAAFASGGANPGIPGTMLTGTVDGSTGATTGSLSWSGVWDGSFHGNNSATTPTGIVGRFQAEAGTPRPVLTPEARINLFLDEGFAGVVGSFAGR